MRWQLFRPWRVKACTSLSPAAHLQTLGPGLSLFSSVINTSCFYWSKTINAKDIVLRTTSRIIIQHVNPEPGDLIPTQYHSKSLKSEALNLAQGIMGGIIIHRHDLVFIILGRKREVRLLHLEGERAYEKRPGFSLPLRPIFFLYCSSKASVRSREITRKMMDAGAKKKVQVFKLHTSSLLIKQARNSSTFQFQAHFVI